MRQNFNYIATRQDHVKIHIGVLVESLIFCPIASLLWLFFFLIKSFDNVQCLEYYAISQKNQNLSYSYWNSLGLSKDLFIKNRTRTVVKLLLFLYEFLWISLYIPNFVIKNQVVYIEHLIYHCLFTFSISRLRRL